MKQSNQVTMPFIHKNTLKPEKEIRAALSAQNNFYNNFNSKRNTGRITRYFIVLRSTKIQQSIFIACLLLIVILLALFLIFLRDSFISSANDLKDSILTSIYAQISGSVQNALGIPSFFSAFLGTFLTKQIQIATPTDENIFDLASFMTNMHYSDEHKISWWKIGFPLGQLVAVNINEAENDTILWIYVDVGHTFYEFTTTNSTNSSFPSDECGTNVGQYNTIEREWYQTGLLVNHTTWTNVYVQTLPENSTMEADLTFSAVTPVRNNYDQIQCIISLDMLVSSIQSYLENIEIPSGSVLAITSSDGFLVALTLSRYSTFDLNENNLISISIQQVTDPIWECVSNEASFRAGRNFTMACEIEGKLFEYDIFQGNIFFSENNNWTLHAVIKSDQVIEYGTNIYNSSFVLCTVICILLSGLVLAFSQILKNLMLTEQTKLLLGQKRKDKFHILKTGINHALGQLDNVTTIHSANNFDNKAKMIAHKIQKASYALYFDYQRLVHSVENEDVCNKIAMMYSIPQYYITPTLIIDSPDANDRQIYHTAKDTNNENSLQNKFISVNPDDSDNLQNSDDDNIVTSTNTIPLLISNHQQVINHETHKKILRIKEIALYFNSQNQLFQDEEFDRFLSEFISEKIPVQTLSLVVHSFDLLSIFMNIYGKMFNDQDMIMASYISLLGFHSVMGERINQSLQFVYRFFILEVEPIRIEVDQILVSLYKLLINKDIEVSGRWTNVVQYVHLIVEKFPLSFHPETFQKCVFYILPNMRYKTLHIDLGIELLRFFVDASSMSYLTENDEMRDHLMSILVDEIQRESFRRQFAPCFLEIYSSMMFDAINGLCGKSFLKALTSA